MRIGLNALFFIPNELDGLGVYLINLVHHLAQAAPQHEYILFVSKESKQFFTNLPSCMEVVVLPVPAKIRPARVLAEQLILPFYIRTKKIDLLHSLAFTAPLFTPCPSVVSIHDMGFHHWSERFSSFSSLIQRKLIPAVARRSCHIITMSHYAKREIALELGIQPSRISVIYEAYDGHRFQQMAGDHRKLAKSLTTRYGLTKPYILSIASLFPHKNLEGLIRAYAYLVAEHGIQHQLLLVGHKRNAYTRIFTLIDGLNLSDRVVLTGFVPDEDIPLLYALADVYVFPSFYEGFGLPLLEAMACGTPIVSSNATSLPEIAEDAALLIDPYNIRAMATGIYQALTDQSLRATLIKRGLKRVRYFSWYKTAEETLKMYETCLQKS